MSKVIHFVVGIDKQIGLGISLNQYELRVEVLCFFFILNWTGN